MDYLKLRKLNKLYFSNLDIARSFGLTEESAKMVANRYVKKGYIIRLKRGLYILREKWEILSREEKYSLANVLQVPSYISLTTALSYYDITTQVQQDFYESISINRTIEILVEDTCFKYAKVKKDFYFGYIKNKGFFIATPEKALLDAIYLMVRGKYNLDISAIDWDKLDKKNFYRFLKNYPKKIVKAILNLCKI